MTSDASNGSSEPPDRRGHRAQPAPDFTFDRNAERKAQDDAWAASGLLMAGVIVWGGAGYLVSEWLDNQLFVMLGLLLGTTTALYGIWFRYGRS
jgi:ATP synthase protein I